ncbi:MAG: DUF1570 domain-containing protein [Planctomycetota bacterium]
MAQDDSAQDDSRSGVMFGISSRRGSIMRVGAENTTRVENGSGWSFERQFGRVHLHADYQPRRPDAMRRTLQSMPGRLRERLGGDFDFPEMHIAVFRDQERMRDYLHRHFPTLPQRQSLYLQRDGKIIVLAFESDQLMTDLRHEATHALLHHRFPTLPLWLDEGLAEYFEVPADLAGENPEHLRTLANARQHGGIRSLEEVRKFADAGSMNQSMYRDAWYWTRYFLNDAKRNAYLRLFLARHERR